MSLFPLRQLLLSFADSFAEKKPFEVKLLPPPPIDEPVDVEPAPVISTPKHTTQRQLTGRDLVMEKECKTLLTKLGLHEGSLKVQVIWNSKLRSTAGYARWPQWQVELNPRLVEFEGQVDRTLKHELAHLIAYARANRRRIEPHGKEWRQACADLGIADESARHTLPLPRTKQTRNFAYECQACGYVVERVRKFRQRTACLPCCKKHNGGRYDARFQFVLKA